MPGYEVVVGLEVHVHLKTRTKLFCGCLNRFGDQPNANTCPVCLGLPGALPVPSRAAFDLAILAALAVDGKVAGTTKFDRKHYFYPDLPKNYQISQYDEPYCRGGGVQVDLEEGGTRTIVLNRIHMEEDAGKLCHTEDSHIADSLVDLNRAGAPLLEIVTEPVIRSPREAWAFLTELKQILQYAGVSDCNMQEGSLRCDANISLRPAGETKLGTKVEIKNLNSFKSVQAALEHEARRQAMALECGEKIVQETRLFDPDKGTTRPMRSKEEADDYRYFPEPDLPRFRIGREWVEEMRCRLGELPRAKRARFREAYGLPDYDVGVLTAQLDVADFFEACAALCREYKEVANWIQGEVLRETGERKVAVAGLGIRPEGIAGLVRLVAEGRLTKKIAREQVFPGMLASGQAPEAIVERLGLRVEGGEDVLADLARKAVAANPAAADDVRAGKAKAMGALVGWCMKNSGGKADPGKVTASLRKELGL